MPPPRTSERVRVEAVPRRWLRRSVVSPRWTTARAVSRGADFRLRLVEPTLAPSKDRIGIVATSERMVAMAATESCLGDLKRRCFEDWMLGLERKMEEEKNEREPAIV